jgi:hypothetical protein
MNDHVFLQGGLVTAVGNARAQLTLDEMPASLFVDDDSNTSSAPHRSLAYIEVHQYPP